MPSTAKVRISRNATPKSPKPKEPEPEPPSTLPDGWKARISRTTGKTYYANKRLGKSQWERPPPPTINNATSKSPKPKGRGRPDASPSQEALEALRLLEELEAAQEGLLLLEEMEALRRQIHSVPTSPSQKNKHGLKPLLGGTEVDNIDEDELLLMKACCCSNTALYTACPDCIGCSGEHECLCVTSKGCLTLGSPSYGVGCGTSGRECAVLKCCCLACGLISPNTCCKNQQHVCCCVINSAFPPTDEVPCMCTLLPFCVLYPECGCCETIGDMRPLSKRELKAKSAPAASMDR